MSKKTWKSVAALPDVRLINRAADANNDCPRERARDVSARLMACGAIAALAACVLMAGSRIAQAAAGEPIPGVDVNLEQVPGGIVANGGETAPLDGSRCDAGVTSAATQKVACVGKVVGKAQASGVNVTAENLQKCQAKYDAKVAKALDAGDCFMQTESAVSKDVQVNGCVRALIGPCVGQCAGGGNDGTTCQYDSDCPAGTCVCYTCGTFVTKWGSFGSGDGQFNIPAGIAVDGSGNVFVTDFYSNRVQKFSSTGTFISKWGSAGSGNGQFNFPAGIAVDGNGDVFVTDFYNDRVQKFTSTGTFLTQWGSAGSGDGQFLSPSGIAVDVSGNVFVTDVYNDRVQKFTSTGTFVAKWGSTGSGDGQFGGSLDVAVDASGNVFVADTYNSRVQKFTGTGTFVTKWGSAGSGNGEFAGFYGGIAVDGNGNVFVTDNGNSRVQKFTNSGTFVTKWGSFGSGDGEFNGGGFFSIAVDGVGSVFVAEEANSRVQTFVCR